MARTVSQTLNIMIRALGRPNAQDPDSSIPMMLQYLNDFIELTMSDDVRMFEQFGTLIFTINNIDPNDGVYTFNDVGASEQFVSICAEGIISLLNPVNNSISWNELDVFLNPFEFFDRWGTNNYEQLTPGFPTEMLFYGNEFTFRTVPNDTFQVTLWGYKKQPSFGDIQNNIPYDRWMRYLAYGAALNYATDFRFDEASLARIQRGFNREKSYMLTHAHNQKKVSRCIPNF